MTVELSIDGVTVTVPSGVSLLEACDEAGTYVPRLCAYPGLPSSAQRRDGSGECGLCLVQLGDGEVTLACATTATPGVEVITHTAELGVLRLERLASILSAHPHICLTCPDRDGCARDECTYGHHPDARCCPELGHCELGEVVAFVDREAGLRRTAVAVWREAVLEGRIRREPGLCIACGRCIAACGTLSEAVPVLQMTEGIGAELGLHARPKRETLRRSGCTFCGRCVLVCPTGALTAPGERGAVWLAERRTESGLLPPVLPSDLRVIGGAVSRTRGSADLGGLATVPRAAGVYQLIDAGGQVLRIGGAADLLEGLTRALIEPSGRSATSFDVELNALYTQRESELLARYAKAHGKLPPGNDLGDELYADDL